MDYFGGAVAEALKLVLDFDPEVYRAVGTSLGVSLSAVLAAALVAMPLGLVVALNRFPGKRLLRQTLNTLMALPTVVVGLFFYGLLSRRGLLGEWGLLYTPVAMIIGQGVLILPIIWNLTITSVEGADKRLVPTCRALGASIPQQAWIVLGEVRFGIIAAVVTGFGRAIGEVGIAMMLGGNIEGYTRTMTTAIALQTSQGAFELALALGVLLLVIAFLINWLLNGLQRKVR